MVEEQRQFLQQMRNAAPEVKIFAAAHLAHLESSLPQKTFKFRHSVEAVIHRLELFSLTNVLFETQPIAIRQAHEEPAPGMKHPPNFAQRGCRIGQVLHDFGGKRPGKFTVRIRQHLDIRHDNFSLGYPPPRVVSENRREVAAAQSQVLQGDAITESAIVDALTPAPQVLTRSISKDAAPAKPASAALLIKFETNATTLTPEAKRELDVVGQALNTKQLGDFKFVIEGHADPRGSSAGNLKLSEGRAAAVRQYLVQVQGVREDRLKAMGKGDAEPLNTRNPAAPENRRVTFVNMSVPAQ